MQGQVDIGRAVDDLHPSHRRGGQLQQAKVFARFQKGNLLSVDPQRLGAPLVWEPSRGGALFPHLYAPMPTSAVVAERLLDLDADGVPLLGALEP